MRCVFDIAEDNILNAVETSTGPVNLFGASFHSHSPSSRPGCRNDNTAGATERVQDIAARFGKQLEEPFENLRSIRRRQVLISSRWYVADNFTTRFFESDEITEY